MLMMPLQRTISAECGADVSTANFFNVMNPFQRQKDVLPKCYPGTEMYWTGTPNAHSLPPIDRPIITNPIEH